MPAARRGRGRPRRALLRVAARRRRSGSSRCSGARGRRAGVPLLAVEGLARRARQPPRDGGRRGRRLVRSSAAGECLALVGESGSGKTTIARCIAGLHEPAAGRDPLRRRAARPRAKGRRARQRRRIQIVFQNPSDSLNPRQRVGDEIARPARVLRDLSRAEAAAEVVRLLERVRLPRGSRQRFPASSPAASASASRSPARSPRSPDLLVCDEITSALDVSVQAAVLDLLGAAQRARALAALHLARSRRRRQRSPTACSSSTRGAVCEQGPVDDVIERPQNEYTRRLVASAPRLPETRVA